MAAASSNAKTNAGKKCQAGLGFTAVVMLALTDYSA
jgi:hypothetical protein